MPMVRGCKDTMLAVFPLIFTPITSKGCFCSGSWPLSFHLLLLLWSELSSRQTQNAKLWSSFLPSTSVPGRTISSKAAVNCVWDKFIHTTLQQCSLHQHSMDVFTRHNWDICWQSMHYSSEVVHESMSRCGLVWLSSYNKQLNWRGLNLLPDTASRISGNSIAGGVLATIATRYSQNDQKQTAATVQYKQNIGQSGDVYRLAMLLWLDLLCFW